MVDDWPYHNLLYREHYYGGDNYNSHFLRYYANTCTGNFLRSN